MRKQMSRVVNVALALMMILSLCPTTAFAGSLGEPGLEILKWKPSPDAEYGLEYQKQDTNRVVICGYFGKIEGKFSIPQTIDGAAVKAIRGNGFDGCSGMTEIVIPEGVEYVGTRTLCNQPKIVHFPSSIIQFGGFEGIGGNPFGGGVFGTETPIPGGTETIYYAGNQNQWNAILNKEYGDGCYNTRLEFTSLTPDAAAQYAVYYRPHGDGSHENNYTPIPETTWYREGDVALVPDASIVPVHSGLHFKGWSDGTHQYQPGDTFIMPAHHVCLRPVWEPIAGGQWTPYPNAPYSLTYEYTDDSDEKVAHYEGLQITGYTGTINGADLEIPETIEGTPVKIIGWSAFRNCKLNSLVLPNSLRCIGTCAFEEAEIAQEQLVIPERVSRICSNAFFKSSGVRFLELPKVLSFYDIEDAYALKISTLEEISIMTDESYYRTIDGVLFEGTSAEKLFCYPQNKADQQYVIPLNVHEIGSGAFSDSQNLRGITIHRGINEIGSGAFWCSVKEDGMNANNLRDIYFAGTEAEWNQISGVADECNAEDLKYLTIHFNSVGPAPCQHQWNQGSITKEPTCTETGLKAFNCTLCGASKTEPVAALGHDWSEWTVTKQPSDSADGEETRTCQRVGCNVKETRTISRLEKQDIRFPAPMINKTYGDADVYNTARNMTDRGGTLTYSSDDPSIAVVDTISGKVTIKGAGKTTITATAAAVPGKYAQSSVSYTLNIAKAPLTIAASNTSAIYGGPIPNFSWTASGFVNGDDESVISGKANYTCGYRKFNGVGEYPVSLSGLTAPNYDITYVDGKLIIDKAKDYTITLDKLDQLAGHTSAVTAQITPWDETSQILVEYQVDGEWVSAVPTAAGAYAVRATLSASDNIEINPTAYTTNTLVVKQGVIVDTGNGQENVDVSVNVNTADSRAEIMVPDEDLDRIAKNANGEVSIDLSGVTGVDHLGIPGELVNELHKNNKTESLTISTEDASVTLTASVLDTMADKITSTDDTVDITLKSVEKNELTQAQQDALNDIPNEAKVVDVSLVVIHPDGTKVMLHELGGEATITVPYENLPGLIEEKYVVACHVSDNGVVTYLFGTCNPEKRTITFTTNHFSTYVVFPNTDPSVVVNGGLGSGVYTAGTVVRIKADDRRGYHFKEWKVDSGKVNLMDSSAAETTFAMPAGNVELSAMYDVDVIESPITVRFVKKSIFGSKAKVLSEVILRPDGAETAPKTTRRQLWLSDKGEIVLGSKERFTYEQLAAAFANGTAQDASVTFTMVSPSKVKGAITFQFLKPRRNGNGFTTVKLVTLAAGQSDKAPSLKKSQVWECSAQGKSMMLSPKQTFTYNQVLEELFGGVIPDDPVTLELKPIEQTITQS